MAQAESRYERRGVSPTKKEVHAAVANVDPGLYPGAFCKVVPDALGGDPEMCAVMHADGAGTKSSLAYLVWKETGDLSVFEGLAQDALVMNTDDLLCVGALDNILVSSTIARNARRIPGEVIAAVIGGFERLCERFREWGVGLTLTGGETADVGDLTPTLIVDSTVTARMRRDAVVDNANIRPGLAVVGLASFGQAAYEETYNSGVGSNGLTSARHDLFAHEYAGKYPETYDGGLPRELVYAGRYRVDDRVEDMPLTVGRAALSPTRTYAPFARRLFDEMAGAVVGLVHCSGGAQTKCLRFGRGVRYVKDNLFDPPPLFRLIRDCSGADGREMYQVFNMGHRLEVYVEPARAGEVVALAGEFGIEARVVGRCEPSPDGRNRVRLETPLGDFDYE